MSELRECPFCGEPEHLIMLPPDHEKKFAGFCYMCLTEGPSGKTEEEAARLWNTRPAPKSAAEEAREIVDAIYAEWDAAGTCGPPIMRKHIAAALAAREERGRKMLKEDRRDFIAIQAAAYERDHDLVLSDANKAVTRINAALRAREEGKGSPKVRKVE